MKILFLTLKILLIILISLVQINFINSLFFPLSQINLIFVLIIYLLIFGSYKEAVLWAVTSGIVAEFFSINIFGNIFFPLLLTLLIINLLFYFLFTNKSFYSLLVLNLIALFFYKIFFVLYNKFFYLINLTEINLVFNDAFSSNLIWGVILNMAVMGVVFIVRLKRL